MALVVDLEAYPYRPLVIEGLQQAIRQAHPEHQNRAFIWALAVIDELAKLDGAWVDARNRSAVEAARTMSAAYWETRGKGG